MDERKTFKHLGDFVPSNHTSVLQPTNMILQCPLKHVFRMAFYGWIINIIKSHIDTIANPMWISKLTAQNSWLVKSSMDRGGNNETFVNKRLGENKTYKGLG